MDKFLDFLTAALNLAAAVLLVLTAKRKRKRKD